MLESQHHISLYVGQLVRVLTPAIAHLTSSLDMLSSFAMLIIAAEVDDSNEAVRLKLLDSHGETSGRDVRARRSDNG